MQIALIRKLGKKLKGDINPLCLNISIHILHSLLYTFPLVLTRRIGFTTVASLGGDHFLYSHDLNK